MEFGYFHSKENVSKYLGNPSIQMEFEDMLSPWILPKHIKERTGVITPEYKVRLEDVDFGKIKKYAKRLKKFPSGTIVRPFHEFNASGWYPWQGNPNLFKSVWEKSYDIFKSEAPHIKVALCFNNTPFNYSHYLPSKSKFDIVGVDGYAWNFFNSIFGVLSSPVSWLRKTGKPVWVFETASPLFQSWYCSTLKSLPVHGLIYFNMNKEKTWRLR